MILNKKMKYNIYKKDNISKYLFFIKNKDINDKLKILDNINNFDI